MRVAFFREDQCIQPSSWVRETNKQINRRTEVPFRGHSFLPRLKAGGIQDGVLMTGEEWSRAMRAIWLLNTIEVEMSHLGIPLMRVPPTLRALGDTVSRA